MPNRWKPKTMKDKNAERRSLRALAAPTIGLAGQVIEPIEPDPDLTTPQCPKCKLPNAPDMLVDITSMPLGARDAFRLPTSAEFVCTACLSEVHLTGRALREDVLGALGAPQSVRDALRELRLKNPGRGL